MAKNKWELNKAFRANKTGAKKGLLAIGEIIGDAAQRITPLDTGELETSQKVAYDASTMTVSIGFSKLVNGADVAVIQHENMYFQHLPGKQAKYLEVPFNALGPGLLPYVLKEEIGKGYK